MEAASRGAKEAGGKTYGVTAEFFGRKINEWVDVEVRKKTWEERLFELIRLADGFVACKGGTGTLVELAVVGDAEQIRDGEETHCRAGRFLATDSGAGGGSGAGAAGVEWIAGLGRGQRKMVHTAATPEEAASYLAEEMKRGK